LVMIAIVDYGSGNLRSVMGALEFLGARAVITGDARDVAMADKLILPGVGSFRVAMENIDRRGLRAPLLESVRERGTPILGICLGMQILADVGDEDGPTPGLGLIPGAVRRFPDFAPPLRVPHIGFNSVTFVEPEGSILAALGDSADFYFIHSYRLICDDPKDVSGWCEYGGERFAASVERAHILGAQFHPEKSQTNGLVVLKSFLERSWAC